MDAIPKLLPQIGHKVSEATRRKIRNKLKGRKISEEARRKRIGRKLSPEHRRKIGLAQKGRKLSEATKRNMRGRKLSEDTKRKLSEGKKGEKNPMYGKRLSEEHRRKIGRKGKLNKNYGKRLSEEHRRNIGLAQKGKKYAPGRIHPMKGKKISEEHRRKLRGRIPWNKEKKGVMPDPWNKGKKGVMPDPWNKGKKGVQVGWNKGMKGVQVGWNKGLTKETDGRVRKISESRMGIKFSEESKKKMSIARKKLHASGYQSPMKGKKHKPESRRKMSLALKGKKYAPERIHPFKGKTFTEEHRRKISSGLKGHITTEETRKRIGAKNKITAKRFWESMTKSQKQNSALAKNWFVKGQVSHNKGKKASITTRKKQSRSATIRFQTQKHPHQGTHRSEKTKRLLREARLRQKPTKGETWPEKFAAKMLKKVKITFEKQKSFRNPPCIVDLYIEPKICVFLDGDYWHCNPNDYVYKKKLNPGFKPNDQISGKKYAKDVWVKDKKITRGLRKKGYSVLRFWQSELETEKEKCLQKIIKAIK